MSHPPPLRLLMWRARVPLTVLATLACGAVVVGSLRTAPEELVPVVVAARQLDAGATLERADLRTALWPAHLAPEGTHDDADHVTGRSLAVAASPGLPLVTGVLADDALWADAPHGTVAAPLRLADTELAGLLRPGDRIDVYAVAHEGGTAQRLAHEALVLKGPRTEDTAGGLFGGAAPAASGLVLVAVTSREAATLAEHSTTSAVTAVLVR